MTDKELVREAVDAMRHAHAPYSRFKVGAALLTTDGDIFKGCNCENASYGLTMCAERVAVGNAVAAGARRFKAMAVVAGGMEIVTPCGACCQVIAEFAPGLRLILANRSGRMTTTSVRKLLPRRFAGGFMAKDTRWPEL
jgi:cytidine deaminase